MKTTSRNGWHARKPRPRTRQSASSVREFFIHWPGAVPNTWRELLKYDRPVPGDMVGLRTVRLVETRGTPADATVVEQHPLEVMRHIRTPAQEAATMRAIQNFHMDTRHWSDFAYGYGLFLSGRVYMGRGLGWVPAAQEGHNTGTTAVCVFLGPNDTIPDVVERQIKTLRRHIENAAGHRVDVRAHRDVGGTECPGPRLAALAHRL